MSDATVQGGTIGEAVGAAAVRLSAVGIGSARLDARLLAAHALGVSTAVVIGYPERYLEPGQARQFDDLVSRRAGREPIAKIIGTREFWSLPFKVTEDTLDPRPESETVIQAALDHFAGAPAQRILDLGTGSGCLLLALLHEWSEADGLGVDVSAAALAVAQANALALGLEGRARFRQGDWGNGLDGSFDCILCNPPYIGDSEMATLEPEVARHEPAIALRGGADGLGCFRDLAPHLLRLLAPDGGVFIEIGAGQDAAVTQIFTAHGLRVRGAAKDLSGRERCLIATVDVFTSR